MTGVYYVKAPPNCSKILFHSYQADTMIRPPIERDTPYNNVVASYSGFNFGIKKTIPHIFGVTFGFTFLVIALTLGLVNIFKLFPIIQNVLKYLGSFFLIYLAYKISFSKFSSEKKSENPISFFDTFIFQFLNPKGVLIGIIIVSTYVEYGENYISYATQVILFAFIISLSSITSVSYTHLTLPTTR